MKNPLVMHPGEYLAVIRQHVAHSRWQSKYKGEGWEFVTSKGRTHHFSGEKLHALGQTEVITKSAPTGFEIVGLQFDSERPDRLAGVELEALPSFVEV